jgi:hypothetical protein
MAALSSARLKKRRLRRRARIQRWYDLHADFDLGLVLRTIGARRQDHGAVVGSEFGHGALQFGVVAVGVADQGAWIVGDDQFGNATDESECPTDGPEPVGLRFGGRSPGVGVI